MLGISSVAEEFLGSQEGLSSVTLVGCVLVITRT
jgi:hypothetical protein